MILQFTFFISSSKSYQNITTKLSSFLWITWRQFQITATRTRYLFLLLWIAFENGRHFAPLVSLRNEVWGPSAEVPCWRRVGSASNWLKICFSVCNVGCFLRLCYGWWENVIPPSSVCEILARIFLELNFLAPEIQDRERKNIVSCLCSVSDCKEMFRKSVMHVKICLVCVFWLSRCRSPRSLSAGQKYYSHLSQSQHQSANQSLSNAHNRCQAAQNTGNISRTPNY